MKNNESIDDWLNTFLSETDSAVFSGDVYDLIPAFLQDLISNFSLKNEKDIVLLSSLVLISGALPNYSMVYDGRRHSANLYAYVFAGFGTGKGIISGCKQLVEPIHREKRRLYKKEKQEYDLNLNSSSRLSLKNDCMHQRPCDRMLLIPANNSKSNLYKLLMENDGQGIICETEAATLITALKQEFGSFKDLILKAFHHEGMSVSRKGDGTIEIDNPQLAILLSSTPKDVLKLFGSIDDGLFSRFLFYKLQPTTKFKNVFEHGGENALFEFAAKGELLKEVYEELQTRVSLDFTFSEPQTVEFLKKFQKLKDEYGVKYDRALDGLINRFGLIFSRIAMVLAILRKRDEIRNISKLPDEIVCSDDDFVCASLLVDSLLKNSIQVYEMLEKRSTHPTSSNTEIRAEQRKRCRELHSSGMTYADIAEVVLGKRTSKGTVSKWLKE